MAGKPLKNILSFWIISWIFLANLFVLVRYVGYNWADDILQFPDKEWVTIFLQATFLGIMIGIVFSIVDKILEKYNAFHRWSFGKMVLVKSSAYFLSALIFLIFAFFMAAYFKFDSSQHAMERVQLFLNGSYLWVILIYFGYNTILLNFIKQVNDKFGPGNILKIFFGSFYKPVEEERIFIFIDLKSSTQYAELLGHEKYSHLIQDCFADITPEVYRHKADIYQYVGDEIVLTWEMSAENFRNSLRLFFGFRKKMQKKSDIYLRKYGFVPEFKAGLNAGKVMVAEVGVIKKEIAYHGDVVNTASRIQMECNVFKKSLLASEFVIDRMPELHKYKIEYVSQVKLKGKRASVNIYSIDKPEGYNADYDEDYQQPLKPEIEDEQ